MRQGGHEWHNVHIKFCENLWKWNTVFFSLCLALSSKVGRILLVLSVCLQFMEIGNSQSALPQIIKWLMISSLENIWRDTAIS